MGHLVSRARKKVVRQDLTPGAPVAVLKELAVTVMTVVEGDGVTGEELPHERCDTRRTASLLAIFIGAKDILALYSPDHNVVKKTCCVEAGLAGALPQQ